MTAEACARCGLLTSRAATFVASTEAAIPHELVRAWREARVRWREPEAHDRLLVLAGRHGRYAWLAARYREIALRDDPIAYERRALVQRSVELTLAVALMRKRDADAEPRSHAATRRLFCVMLAVLALGVVLTKLLAGVA